MTESEVYDFEEVQYFRKIKAVPWLMLGHSCVIIEMRGGYM